MGRKVIFGTGLRLWACLFVLFGLAAVAALASPSGLPSGGVASAAKGDFSLDFIAAQHDTYYHSGPDEGNEIGPIEGQDLGYDDRTSNVDVKEELEASDFACGDRIVFFTRVTVDESAVDTDQTIHVVYHFDAHNNGQQGVGYEEVLAVGISAVDFPPPSQTGDDGNIGLDGTETASLVSQAYIPAGSVFGDPDPTLRADVLEAVVKVTGLDAGEQLIVRIDTRFSCFAYPVTGNLHAAISGAYWDADGDGAYPDADDDKISVGQQDVPMLGLGEVPTADVEKVSLTVGTPDPATGECILPAPTDINASEDETICTRQVIRNNGPAEPVDVVDTLTLTAPPGCTIIPSDPVVWSVSLPAGVDVSRDDNFTIHCSQASSHVFTFEDEIVITTEGLTDDNPDNNFASAQLSVIVWAEADVKIVDQYFVDPPSEIAVSADTPVTLRKILHNNGPYPEDVAVTVDKAASAPADCTITPASVSEQVILPMSVPVTLEEPFIIHCSSASSHTFSVNNSVRGPKDVHVVDPEPENNSWSSELTVAAIGQADLKIREQYVACIDVDGDGACTDVDLPPTQIPVSETVSIILDKIIHNNGPHDVQSAVATGRAIAPADCEVLNPTHEEQISPVPVSVDIAIKEPFTIHCYQPSEHTFAFDNVIAPKDPHIVDPDPTNNSFYSEWTVPALAEADLKIVDQGVVDWPTDVSVSETAVVTLATEVHNNGPYAMVEAQFQGWLTGPADCTITPDVISGQIVVAVGQPQTIQQEFSIHCLDHSLHTFTLHNSVTGKEPHIVDFNEANNAAEITLPSIAVWAEADVKIVDQYFVDPPESMDVSVDTLVSLRKVLHNNGPYTGTVTVTVDNTATAPADCSITPVAAINGEPVTLPHSVAIAVQEDFIIHCSRASSHTFSVENRVSGPQELHINDPDPTNNSRITDLTVDDIGQADVKVVGVEVSGPEEVDVSQNADITVSATLHNNGPYGPVNVSVGYTATTPADCEVYGGGEPQQYELPVSVDVVDDHVWSIHCSQPSEHTFSFVTEILTIKDPHVVDPNPNNNSGSVDYRVVARGYADVKIVDQYFVDPPTEIDVSVDTPVTLLKVLHNNGPYTGDVTVSVSNTSIAPADCTMTPVSADGSVAEQILLPMSVEVPVEEQFIIHCSQPSSHTFRVENEVSGPQEPHVGDPDLSNNTWATDLTVAALGDADVKILDQQFYGPDEIDVSVASYLDLDTLLHNNGPDGPVQVSVGYTATAPADCEIYGGGEPRQVDLPASVDVWVFVDFEVHCYGPSEHTFSVETSVGEPKEPHIGDPDLSNNSWVSDFTVDAIAEADVKIVDQYFVDPPEEIDVSVDTPVTLHKVLHNNGPYEGSVTVTVSNTPTAPADCTMVPAVGGDLIDGIELPYSVAVPVEETFIIHCSEPSEHMFSVFNEVSGPQEPHVRDPYTDNNSWTTDLWVDAIAEADVKIVDQYFVDPPAEMDVSVDTVVTLEKVLHNNGPYDGVVTVTVSNTPDAPADCTMTPALAIDPNGQGIELPASVDVEVYESFIIHCSEPSSHTFSVENRVSGPEEPHIGDPDLTNNSWVSEFTVDALAEADVKIVNHAPYVPTEMDISVSQWGYVDTLLHNNGPYGPVEVTLDYTATVPADCDLDWYTDWPQQVELPVSVETWIYGDFDIHCYEPSSHTFVVESSIGEPKEPHVSDPDLTNNSWSTEFTVDALAEADVKIVDQYFVDPPQDIDVSVDTPVTLRKVLHNNGPYTGDVTVSVSNTTSAPADCTMIPADLGAIIDGQVVLPVSVDVEVEERFTIHCSQPSYHTFWVYNEVSGPQEPHVYDPDSFNNSWDSELSVEAIGDADVKVVDQDVVVLSGAEIDISVEECVDVYTYLHNNGPDGPVEVSLDYAVTAPADCDYYWSWGESQQVYLPVSVETQVNAHFDIHCYQPSEHSFSVEVSVGEPKEPHIGDPDLDNNSWVSDFTVDAIAEADVKIVDQYFVDPPEEIDVSVDTPVTLHKVLHNNGPYEGSVTVTVSNTPTAPADCTMVPAVGGDLIDGIVLPYSVAVPVEEAFIIHCSEPSEHMFSVYNEVSGPQEPHVRDPYMDNNSWTTELWVDALAEADVKIVDQYFVDAPEEMDVSVDTLVTLRKVLHNNGPYDGVVTVTVSNTPDAPADCTMFPAVGLIPDGERVELPTSVDVEVDESFIIHCSEPSSHTFSVANEVSGPEEPHIGDPDLTNNSWTSEFTVEVLAEADVKVVGYYYYYQPEEMEVSVTEWPCLDALLHNNGPYGPVEVTVDFTATAPADCDISYSYGPQQVELPVSVQVPVHADFEIHCYGASEHTFWLEASAGEPKEPHVSDPDLTNNSLSSEFTVEVIGEADLKISDQRVACIDADGDGACTDNDPDPVQIPVSEDVPIIVEKVVHNNGPEDVESARTTGTAIAPADCEVLNPVHEQQIGPLPVSVAITVKEPFTIHCHKPSEHTFGFENVIAAKDPHIVDPYPDNNTAYDEWTVPAIAEADLKIVDQSTVVWPDAAKVSEDESVTLATQIHNNGPYGPVEVELEGWLEGPADCEIWAELFSQQFTLEAGQSQTVEQQFTIHCEDPSLHTFTLRNILNVKDPHVYDLEPDNNSATRTLPSVEFWAAADVKIVDQYFVNPPEEMDVSVDTLVTLHKVLHNNGPYPGSVTVYVSNTPTAPADCTMVPALGFIDDGIVLPMSVDVEVDESFIIHCSQPSEHTFSVANEVSEPQEPHIGDPDLTNNSRTTDLTVVALAEADVKIVDQYFVDPPAEMDVSVDTLVTLRKVLHNNGPYDGLVTVYVSNMPTAPADCTMFPALDADANTIPDGIALPASVDVEVEESFVIHCSQPSEHTFSVANEVSGPLEPHIGDPDMYNNSWTSEFTVDAIAYADVKIVDQYFVNPPEEMDVSVDTLVTLRKILHNNGPYDGAVTVNVSNTPIAPADCTMDPAVFGIIDEGIRLPASVDVEVEESFIIHCSEPSSHTFRVENEVSVPEEPHVEDPDIDNNSWATELTVVALAEADVKIVDQYFVDPPAEMDVSTDTLVTLRKVLHNNGPYDGVVTVTVSNTPDAPADCTMVPAVGLTPDGERVELPTSVDVEVEESFIIHCSKPSSHTFRVANEVSGPEEPHIGDPDMYNNSWTSEFTVVAIDYADVKVVGVDVIGPAEIDLSQDVDITVAVTYHNNGPYGPVTVAAPAFNIVAPAGCTAEPLPCLRLLELPVSELLTAECTVEIHCSEPSTHTFEVDAFVEEPQDVHVDDPDLTNNSGSAEYSVEVWAYADVKVVGVEVVGPEEIDVSEGAAITVSTTLHNNGPYGPVNVSVGYLEPGVPTDCEVATVGPPQYELPVSVEVVDDHTWEIHCFEPSEHTFSFSTYVSIKDPHVEDTDLENNDGSGDYTVVAIDYADVKVVDVEVFGPGEIDVSEDETITVRTTLHNNGPYGPAEVSVSYRTPGVPADCEVATVGPPQRVLPVSVDVVDDHTWEIHCSEPSEHTFSFGTDIDVKEPHVEDPNLANNGGSADYTVEAIAEADVKIVDQFFVDPPTETDVSVDTTVTLSTVLHNNGPYPDPVDVTLTTIAAAPDDCTMSPALVTEELELPVSADVTVDQEYTIHCSEPCDHDFAVDSTIGVDTTHVVDPEVTNNSASTDLSLAVWAEADLKITSQSLVDPPSEIPANQDVVITLRKDIHNNGPYGPLDVSVVSSATASAACTVTPATQDFVLNAVPVSTAQVLDETWTINCSEVGEHVFTFANAISATAEHVEGSDSASTELRVTVPPVILPTVVPPTPTVTPPVLPTALPPTGGSGLTQLTTGWQALVFLGGAMALMLAGMGSAMWSLRRRSK